MDKSRKFPTPRPRRAAAAVVLPPVAARTRRPLPVPKPHAQPAQIQLVAVDLDGTLLSSRKTITPRTHTALREVIARGVKVILATARPPRSVRGYYEALKLDTPQINYNGALIWDEPHRQVLFHRPLAAEVARAIVSFARRKYPRMLVSVEILDKWYTDHHDPLTEFLTETSKHFTPDFIGPLRAFLNQPITKLMLLGKPAWIADVEARLPGKFGRRVAYTRSDEFLLQIMSPGVSKAVALKRICTMLGVDPRHVLAIGDAPNDVHMMEWAGLAVAPENAWPQARRAARYVVPSNDEDGVTVALRRYVLGEGE